MARNKSSLLTYLPSVIRRLTRYIPSSLPLTGLRGACTKQSATHRLTSNMHQAVCRLPAYEVHTTSNLSLAGLRGVRQAVCRSPAYELHTPSSLPLTGLRGTYFKLSVARRLMRYIHQAVCRSPAYEAYTK